MRADYVNLSNKAFVRFIHASPNFRATYFAPDTFNVYIDSTRINSPFFTYNSVFPVATTSSYAAVNSGIVNLRFSTPGVFKADSLTFVGPLQDTLTTGMTRTYIIADTFIVKLNDQFSEPLTGLYNIRFVHAVVNDTIGKTVDIYSTRRNGNIFTNVKPKTVFGFQTAPYNAQLNDTLYVRRSGTTINLASGVLPGGLPFFPNNQRAYTLIYKGDGRLTTGTKARTLSMITNQ